MLLVLWQAACSSRTTLLIRWNPRDTCLKVRSLRLEGPLPTLFLAGIRSSPRPQLPYTDCSPILAATLHRLLPYTGCYLTLAGASPPFLCDYSGSCDLRPLVMVINELDADLNNNFFLPRFREAVEWFSTVFDSLEAGLPRASPHRHNCERLYFARDIINVVACEGLSRAVRAEKMEAWQRRLREAGLPAPAALRAHCPCRAQSRPEGRRDYASGTVNPPVAPSVSPFHGPFSGPLWFRSGARKGPQHAILPDVRRLLLPQPQERNTPAAPPCPSPRRPSSPVPSLPSPVPAGRRFLRRLGTCSRRPVPARPRPQARRPCFGVRSQPGVWRTHEVRVRLRH